MRKGRQTKSASRRENPPQLSTNITIKHRYRFRSTSGSAEVILDNEFVSIVGIMTTVANSQGRLIAGSCKVHEIEIWTPPASQGAAATCSVEWAGTQFSPSSEASDTTVSVAVPAHVKTAPPPGSAASFWMQVSSSNMCTITAPTGSIIDVVATHILLDTGAVGASYTVGTAPTIGIMFYPPLDGASDIFVPVSLTTLT